LLRNMDSIPNGETFFVGAADALATELLAALLPRFVPGSEALAAGLTDSSPAFSIDKARRLLGWEPQRTWRTELGQADLVGAATGFTTTASATPGSQETK